jgi:excisionase family DNA binding protein
MEAIKRLLTRGEAAQALAISIRLLDELILRGDLPAVRIGRSVRVRPAALANFTEARESKGLRRPVKRQIKGN